MTCDEIESLPPEEMLKQFANFKHYQILGACLDYNPEIKAGLSQPLKDWDYDRLDESEKKPLDTWTKRRQAAPETMKLLLSAATPLWNMENLPYRKVLEEIADHLNAAKPVRREIHFVSDGKNTSKVVKEPTDADWEIAICQTLLKDALAKIEKLDPKEKKKFDNDLDKMLRDQGIDRGGKSASEFLMQSGLAGGSAFIGTQIVAGVILSHLGIWNGLLFAAGLYAVPTFLIGSLIFAPLMGLVVTYQLGSHNYKKTIPFVLVLASIRQEQMLLAKQSNPDASNI